MLKDGLALLAGEILDGTFMSKNALVAFLEEQIADARELGVLFSLHMKATMMKVSDPIIFGHAVRVYFARISSPSTRPSSTSSAPTRTTASATSSLDSRASRPTSAPDRGRHQAAYDNGPALAMVNSDKGITNLHVRATSSSTPPCPR